MKKEVILTGIKPTGDLHIGNYLGAMQQMIDFSKTRETFAFLADTHTLNFLQDARQVYDNTIKATAAYIAMGLDMEKTILFRQSDVPEVLELSTLLMNVTPKGLMNRAHSYKDKVAKNEADGRDKDDGVNMGLYTYPVLMAADILIYDSTIVPIGADQKQHVEFARDIAGYFNNVYGEMFVMPEPLIKEDVGLIKGTDGRKMSKSYGNTLPLFGDESELRKKIMGIVTDSASPEDKKNPDESTIFYYYKYFATADEITAFRAKFENGGTGYGDLKKELFEKINSFLTAPREIYNDLMANPEKIEKILADGAVRARPTAAAKLAAVKKAMLG